MSTENRIKTPLTELTGVEHPIVQTGMGWVAGPRLVTATAEAGALGILASATMTLEQLEHAIVEVKSLTDKPFGVNITLMPSFRITEEVFDDFFKVCAEEKVTNIEVSGMFATKYIPMPVSYTHLTLPTILLV